MIARTEQYTLLRLILGAMDESLTAAEFAVLDSRLRNDPEALNFYAQVMRMQTLLVQSREVFVPRSDEVILDDSFWAMLLDDQYKAEPVAVEQQQQKPTVVPLAEVPKPSYRVSKTPLAVAISALAAFLMLAAYVYFNPRNPAPLVGRLTRTVDAQWANATGVISSNADLYAGPLHLTKGYAELYTENGTQVILQAPVELDLESPSQFLLRRGRITVHIQQTTSDFVVRTPTASVVDFGTEFGVYVDDHLNTVTHVYQGQVELRSGSNPLRFEQNLSLRQGQGGLVDPQGKLKPKDNAAGHFMRSEEFGFHYLAAQGSAYYRWKAYSLQLSRDPDVAAYYTFEKKPDQADVLVNVAESTFGGLNGRLRSAKGGRLPTWTQGRWPEKTALAFDRTEHQYIETAADARISLNGPITVAAWICRESPKDGGHIVSNRVSTDSLCNYQLGYRSPTTSTWQKSLHLARKLNSKDNVNQISSVPLPDIYGWTLVAATHDNQTLKFYLNGRLVDTQHWPYKQDWAVANLLIGSDFVDDPSQRFNGKMGEIVVAKRVFSDQEIARMYEAGKP